MKSNILILFFIFGIALLSFASAAAISPDNVVGNSLTIDHDKSFEIKFNLKNDDPEHNFTDLKILLPTLNIGQWTSAKISSTSYPIVNNQVTLNDVTVANKTSSSLITLVFKVDKYVAPNTYNGQVSFSGKLAPSGSSASIDSLSVSITVKSTPSLSLSKLSELKINQAGSVSVVNTGNILLNSVSLAASGPLNVSLVPSESFSLSPGNNQTVQIKLDPSITVPFGEQTTTLIAKSGDVQSPSLSLTLTNSFCKNGQVGNNLTIRNVDFVEYGEDDTDWKLLDHIKLDVEVENTGSDDVNDVIVELGLFNSKGENVIGDIDFISKDDEKIDLGRIRDTDEETATFEFTVPADLDTGSYKLAVKTYSDDVTESALCADKQDSDLDARFYQNIRVEKEDDEGRFIAFDNIRLVPSEATCEDPVALTADVYNIGDEDQDRVLVNLFNKVLGIDLNYEIRGGLDQGDKGKVLFNFAIPKNALDKTYDLELSSEYDYKNGIYRLQSDESFSVPIKVVGCSAQPLAPVTTRIASISAAPLESDPVAGEDLIVTATIRNIGNASASFIVGAKNFEDWAKLNDVSERIVNLNAGESREVEFNFAVNSNAEGKNTFLVEVILGNDKTKIETREVEVTIVKPSTSVSEIFKGNTLAWVIGLINVLLIIIIIIVAVRIARR